MEDGLYGSKEISTTIGGCAMNTSRAANFYLQALEGQESSRVKTLGSIGKDKAGAYIVKELNKENLLHDLYEDETALTGQCAVTVVKVDRTCIAILDACEKYPTSHIVQ